MNFAKLKKTIPILISFDMEESQYFYHKKMGFWCELIDDKTLVCRRDEIEIQISELRNEVAAVKCQIKVVGIEDLYEEYFFSNAVKTYEKIKESRSGTREFRIIDPSGNHLIFFEEDTPMIKHSLPGMFAGEEATSQLAAGMHGEDQN